MTVHTHLRPAPGFPLQMHSPLPVREEILEQAMFGVVAYEFGVCRADLISDRRSPDFVRGRAFFTWALRSLGQPHSYSLIGDLLGGRHHTTIMSLHEKAILLRLKDAEFKGACYRLAKSFKAMGEVQ